MIDYMIVIMDALAPLVAVALVAGWISFLAWVIGTDLVSRKKGKPDD